MRKLHLLFALLFLSAVATKAQPAFTRSNYPSAGTGVHDTFRAGSLTQIYNFLDAETGANYTWDYSASNIFMMIGAPYTFYYIVPDSANYTPFPSGSNLRETSNLLYIDNLYESKGDTIFLTRSGTSVSTGTILIPKMPWMAFPLNFGDNFTATQVLYANAQMTVPSIKRTHTAKYDGYGTVKLPWGTFSNIYRINNIIRDSSYAGGVLTYAEYDWYTSAGVPVMRMGSSSYGDSVSHIIASFVANTNATSSGTGIQATSNVNNTVSIYPNPANESLNVRNTEGQPLNITIIDATGRQVLSQLVTGTTNILSIRNLPAGTYHINGLSIDGHMVLNKFFVKE